jgi:hypothetical protein
MPGLANQAADGAAMQGVAPVDCTGGPIVRSASERGNCAARAADRCEPDHELGSLKADLG